MSEKEILKAVKKNNKRAQRLLYDQYRSLWYSICLRYTKQEHDAQDVLQNALVNIFSKVAQYKENKGSFKSWSSKIVVNHCLMFLRKNSITTSELNSAEEYHLKSDRETAIESLSAKELIRLIQELPKGYQSVFNLYVIEGYAHQEIADLLEISVGTSKSQLFKARKLLQEKLAVLI